MIAAFPPRSSISEVLNWNEEIWNERIYLERLSPNSGVGTCHWKVKLWVVFQWCRPWLQLLPVGELSLCRFLWKLLWWERSYQLTCSSEIKSQLYISRQIKNSNIIHNRSFQTEVHNIYIWMIYIFYHQIHFCSPLYIASATKNTKCWS